MKKKIWTISLILPLIAGLFLMSSVADNKNTGKVKTTDSIVSSDSTITVDKTIHDFGTISEDGGSVSAVFTLKNAGDQPFIIQNARASCGCTTPSKTEGPVEPGKTGEVTATYNPKGRPGPFEKSVTITLLKDGKTETVVVKIKGKVEKAQ